MIDAAEFEDLLGSPRLRLRRRRNGGGAVLYIHGATFPCALAIGYRFAGGRSWEDALAEAGFEVWGLDFAGYGGSERPDQPEFLGRAEEAMVQIARAVAFIRGELSGARINIIAHSWGSIPAAMFAAACPDAIATLTLFGPILARDGALSSLSSQSSQSSQSSLASAGSLAPETP